MKFELMLLEVSTSLSWTDGDWERAISAVIFVTFSILFFWLIVVRNSNGVTIGRRFKGWLAMVWEIYWSS